MPVNYDNAFPSRLRIARKKKDLTQAELADRTGISRRRIAGYESGETKPPIDNLHALAEALEIDASWLAGVRDDSLSTLSKPRVVANQASAMPLHLPEDIRSALAVSAKSHHLSLNEEIIRRLKLSLEHEKPTLSDTLLSVVDTLHKRGL